MLRDLLDRVIRTRGQVWRELQIACIAVVPRVKSSGAKHALSNPRSTVRPKSKNIVPTENPIWTVTDAPQSRFAESFLEIKLAIDSMNRNGKRNQVIGITSTQPGEGKSTVAAALALLMAQTGARVILVDCNLRNRSLSAALAPAAEFGGLDVMSGTVPVREITWTDPITRLAFLPVGSNSRSIYASEVLASETLDKLFRTLRETYEYVIVDLPAVTPFADVRAAAYALDSFIFVIEASHTNINSVKRALDVVPEINENMIGIVLNKGKCDDV
jgi:capsular exopolysaccharide synthesis family protein